MKIRQKLPELMVEASMVVLAVVIALAVDEWREDKQQEELAERALQVVIAEIESNRDEVVESAVDNTALLEQVVAAAATDSMPPDFDLTFEYSLISSSGWETAQMTQATHFMSLDQVQNLARLYGMQDLFQQAQDRMLAFILDIGQIASDDVTRIPDRARAPLTTAVGMGDALVEAYDRFLEGLEDRSPGGG